MNCLGRGRNQTPGSAGLCLKRGLAGLVWACRGTLCEPLRRGLNQPERRLGQFRWIRKITGKSAPLGFAPSVRDDGQRALDILPQECIRTAGLDPNPPGRVCGFLPRSASLMLLESRMQWTGAPVWPAGPTPQSQGCARATPAKRSARDFHKAASPRGLKGVPQSQLVCQRTESGSGRA